MILKINKNQSRSLEWFSIDDVVVIWPVTGQEFRLEMAKLASFNENFEFEYVTVFSRLLGNGKHFPIPYFKKLVTRYSQKPPEAVDDDDDDDDETFI